MEIWKSIPGYEGRYEASSYGRIRSVDHAVKVCGGSERISKGKLLKPQLTSNGYLIISLGRKDKHKLVHRLVAETFIANENSLPDVNHKNLIKTDNRAENLEWVTRAENRQHAHDNGAFPVEPHRKKILCVETGKEFPSSYQAAEWINENQYQFSGSVKGISSNIRMAARKRRKAYSFHWKHVIE